MWLPIIKLKFSFFFVQFRSLSAWILKIKKKYFTSSRDTKKCWVLILENRRFSAREYNAIFYFSFRIQKVKFLCVQTHSTVVFRTRGVKGFAIFSHRDLWTSQSTKNKSEICNKKNGECFLIIVFSINLRKCHQQHEQHKYYTNLLAVFFFSSFFISQQHTSIFLLRLRAWARACNTKFMCVRDWFYLSARSRATGA